MLNFEKWCNTLWHEFWLILFYHSKFDSRHLKTDVTRPLCLVQSHICYMPLQGGCALLFMSFTFCNITISCSLIPKENIRCSITCVSLIERLAAINLYKWWHQLDLKKKNAKILWLVNNYIELICKEDYSRQVYVQVVTAAIPLHKCAPGKRACPLNEYAFLCDTMSLSELIPCFNTDTLFSDFKVDVHLKPRSSEALTNLEASRRNSSSNNVKKRTKERAHSVENVRIWFLFNIQWGSEYRTFIEGNHLVNGLLVVRYLNGGPVFECYLVNGLF